MGSSLQNSRSLVEHYEKLAVLGEGSSGTTYLARSVKDDAQVALKELSLRACKDWKMLELFEREVAMLKTLEHSAIPRYVDAFVAESEGDRQYYLAQTIAEGKSLESWIADGWRCTEADAVEIAEQLLEILVYLQSLKPPIIHRDIKPSNVIRSENGKVSLVDFGAVGHTYHNTFMKGSTVVGTFGYMAPEQFRGRTLPATDLYSVGATLLFLVTRRSPTELPVDNLSIDFRGKVNLSEGFATWLETLINPDLDIRFSNATASLKALKRRSKWQRIPQLKTAPSFLWLGAIALISILFATFAIRYRYAILPRIANSRSIEHALITGDLPTADYISGGGSVDIHSPQANTLFVAALQQRDSDLVMQMLQAGMDVYQRDRNGDTPLHILAKSKNTAALDFLVERMPQINIDAVNKNNATPLQVTPYPSMAIALINAGADFLKEDELGASVLDKSLVAHSRNAAEWLKVSEICLEKLRAAPKYSGKLNAQVDKIFYQNAQRDNVNAILFLAEEGIKIHEKRAEALRYYAFHGESMRRLADAFSNISVRDHNGFSLLHIAASRGDIEMMRFLLDRGIDVDIESSYGKRPIRSALSSGWKTGEGDIEKREIAQNGFWFLVESGADLEANEQEDRSILAEIVSIHISSSRSYRKDGEWARKVDINMPEPARLEAVKKLIQAGADINAVSRYGSTPLHISYRSPDVARLLIQSGADINAKNKDSETPLFWARDIEFARLLLQAGADINAKNNENHTPLSKTYQRIKEQRSQDLSDPKLVSLIELSEFLKSENAL